MRRSEGGGRHTGIRRRRVRRRHSDRGQCVIVGGSESVIWPGWEFDTGRFNCRKMYLAMDMPFASSCSYERLIPDSILTESHGLHKVYSSHCSADKMSRHAQVIEDKKPNRRYGYRCWGDCWCWMFNSLNGREWGCCHGASTNRQQKW